MQSMFIERDGKEYELTYEELSEANTKFVTNQMESVLNQHMMIIVRRMNNDIKYHRKNK